MTMRGKVLQIARHFELYYGPMTWESHGSPLDILIWTILSQNTNDQNRDRAYESLKGNFPSYEDIARALTGTVADAIRIGGLHRQKAKRIQEILKRIKKEHRDYDLTYLENLNTEEAIQALLKFDGVGKKTAGVVLMFSLGKPYLPVDTHIDRIARRLGWVKKGQDSHDVMNVLVPDKLKYQLHLHLIRHGRQTCKARKPLCGECLIDDLCPKHELR